MKKRILAMVLTVCMVLSMLPMSALAARSDEVADIPRGEEVHVHTHGVSDDRPTGAVDLAEVNEAGEEADEDAGEYTPADAEAAGKVVHYLTWAQNTNISTHGGWYFSRGTAAALALSEGSALPTQVGEENGVNFKIHGGRYLHVESDVNNTNHCKDDSCGDKHLFTFAKTDNGTYTIKSVNSGKYLSTEYCTYTPGNTYLQIQVKDAAGAAEFHVTSTGTAGRYYIWYETDEYTPTKADKDHKIVHYFGVTNNGVVSNDTAERTVALRTTTSKTAVNDPNTGLDYHMVSGGKIFSAIYTIRDITPNWVSTKVENPPASYDSTGYKFRLVAAESGYANSYKIRSVNNSAWYMTHNIRGEGLTNEVRYELTNGGEIFYITPAATAGESYIWWTEDKTQFTVSFNTDGGNEIDAITAWDGEAVGALPTPVKDGYIFDGWYVGDTKLTATTPVTADITATARWTEPEAKVEDKYYRTVQAAVTAIYWAEGKTGTVTVLKDATFAETATASGGTANALTIWQDSNVTLDLKGKTVRGVIWNYGNLTITGEGTVDCQGLGLYALENYKTLTIKNGNYLTDPAFSTMMNSVHCTTLIQGGYFNNGLSNDGQVYKANPAQGEDPVESTHPDTTTVTITGGVFDWQGENLEYTQPIFNMGATLNIEGGEFLSQHAVQKGYINNWGTLNISGGKITAPEGCPVIYSRRNDDIAHAHVWKGDINITGGELVGDFELGSNDTVDHLSVSGGVFSVDVNKYCVDGKKAVENEAGKWTVENKVYVAAIGVAQYESLQAALDAAKSGDTVTLLADIAESARLTENKAVTLNAAGRTVAATVFVDAGELIVSGEGNFEAMGNDDPEDHCFIVNGGKLVIEGGSFKAACTVVYVVDGAATVNGGTFAVEAPEGAWWGSDFLLNLKDGAQNAVITVNGGEFTGFDPANSASENPKANFVAADKTAVENEKGVWTIQKAAAQLISLEGGAIKGYATVEEAIAASEPGDTVKLLANAGEFEVRGKAIVVDKNGHTATIKAQARVLDSKTDDLPTEEPESALYGDLAAVVATQDWTYTATAWRHFIQLFEDVTLAEDLVLPSYNQSTVGIYAMNALAIDLNGYDITQTPSAAKENTADGTTKGWNGYAAVVAMAGGEVVITGNGTVTGSAQTLDVVPGAALTLKGGTYTTLGNWHNEYDASMKGPYPGFGSIVRMTGGTLNVEDGVSMVIPEGDKVKMAATIMLQGAKTLNSTRAYTVNITGGNIQTVPAANKPADNFEQYYPWKDGFVAINSYILNDKDENAKDCQNVKINITGGTFDQDVSKYCVEPLQAVKTGDVWEVKPAAAQLIKLSDNSEIAYATVKEAIAASEPGDTVKLLAQPEGAVVVLNDKAVRFSCLPTVNWDAVNIESQARAKFLDGITGSTEMDPDNRIYGGAEACIQAEQAVRAKVGTPLLNKVTKIFLSEDWTLEEDVILPTHNDTTSAISSTEGKTIRINLAGHTLKQMPSALGHDGFAAVMADTNSTLIIEGEGTIIGSNMAADVCYGGTLTLAGGTLTTLGSWSNMIGNPYGTVVRMKGGTLNVKDGVNLKIPTTDKNDSGKPTLMFSTILMRYGTNTLNIEGGNFEIVPTDKRPGANALGSYECDGLVAIRKTDVGEITYAITGGTFGMNLTDAKDVKGNYYLDNTKYAALSSGDDSWTVQLNAVAQVGDESFATLQAAVNAAEDGAIVTLLQNVENGSGVIVNKNLTIDFAGYSYAIGKTPLAGSGEKYATQAFQLLAGDNKKEPYSVTMKNGTIVLPEVPNLQMGIQNYTNLTLDHMTIDASANADIGYVVSNNNGTTTITGGTVIAAAPGNVAFDVYDFRVNGYDQVNVTVEDATVTGRIEVSEADNVKLTVKGGTFTSDVNEYCATGYCQNASGVVGAHTMTATEAKAATCTENGNNAYWTCATCNKVFKDEAGTQKTTVEAETIPATGHTLVKVEKAPTFDEKGIQAHYECSVCGAKFWDADGTQAIPEGTDLTIPALVAVAQVGEVKYKTLAEAIAEADGATVTLLQDAKESVTVAAGKTVTLDLNGNTLTNADGQHTIVNNGTLTVFGGTVDNVSHQKAAIVNHGTASLTGGTFKRSGELGQSASDNGGNSYYTVVNQGVMTISGNTAVENSGKYSSMIENGYPSGGKDGVTLTIEGGTFEGGLYNVKNDDWGKLVITGGAFSGASQGNLLNWNVTEINGNATFTGSNTVILNAYSNAEKDQGKVSIAGGTFEAAEGGAIVKFYGADAGKLAAAKDGFKIMGGTFNQDVNDYCDASHCWSADDSNTVKTHAWGEWDVTTEATCAETGVKEHVCSRCQGTERQTIEKDPNNHTGGTRTENAKDATCIEAGYTGDTYCEGCNKQLTTGETIEALDHDMHDVEGSAKAATCTEAGNEADQACSRCGHKVTGAEIPATGHTMTHVPAVNATCAAEGTKEHWHCANCGKDFEDENGNTALDTVVIPIDPNAHNFDPDNAEYIDPTCTTAGSIISTCTLCGSKQILTGEPQLGHKRKASTDNKAATCTEPGWEGKYVCERCGEVLEEGHELAATGHEYADVVTNPTCTTGGYTTHTCGKCNDSYTDSETEMLGHDFTVFNGWGAWEATETGYTRNAVVKCSREGCNATEPQAAEVELTEEEASTCKEKGHKTYTSTWGTETDTKTDTLPLAEHQYQAEVTAPTCTEDGFTTHTCSECGDSYTDSETTMLGHDMQDVEGTDKAATCTETGKTADKKCSRCGHTEAGTAIPVDPSKHTLDHHEAKAAACLVEGNIEYWTCTACGKLFRDADGTDEITLADTVTEALLHEMRDVAGTAKEATCTEEGKYIDQECIREGCDYEVTGTTIPTIPHTSMDSADNKDATCTEAGLTGKTECSVCHTVLNAGTVLPALTHNFTMFQSWNDWAGDAETGYTRTAVVKCSRCDATEDLDAAVTLTDEEASTCVVAGHKTYTSTWGTETDRTTVELPLAAHNTDGVVEHKDPSCTETGVVGGTYCTVCENGKEAAEAVIPMVAHTIEKTEAAEPTCTEAGNSEYWTCSVCGKLFSDEAAATEIEAEDTVIAALGHEADENRWLSDGTGHWHPCVRGDDHIKEVTAHDELAVTTSGRTRTVACSVCGYVVRTETLPAPSNPGGNTPSPAPEEDLDDPDVPLVEKPFLFTDVSEDDWFYDAVKFVSAANMMVGVNTEGTLFAPALNTTRASLAQIIFRLEQEPDAPIADFIDVADQSWYAEAVNWNNENGTMIGYTDNTFRPDQDVKRQELVTVLYRYAKRLGMDVTAEGDLSAFVDADQVGDWAKDAMVWAVGTGLIKGRGTTLLAPNGTATRGELATILTRFQKMMPAAE